MLGKMSMHCGKSEISTGDFIALTDKNENSITFGVNDMEMIFGKTEMSIQTISINKICCFQLLECCYIWGINIRIDGSELFM